MATDTSKKGLEALIVKSLVHEAEYATAMGSTFSPGDEETVEAAE